MSVETLLFLESNKTKLKPSKDPLNFPKRPDLS